MEWLKQAVDAGFSDAARVAQAEELDDLRNREDFQALLAELMAE
jgi:hypothetical protein